MIHRWSWRQIHKVIWQMLEQEEEGGFGKHMEDDETEDESILEDAEIDLEDEDSQEKSLGNIGMRQMATGGSPDMRIF